VPRLRHVREAAWPARFFVRSIFSADSASFSKSAP
jgi:hypothetical protein